MTEQALVLAEETSLDRTGRYDSALKELQSKVSFVNEVARSILVEGKDGEGDYSVIPGTKKKTLHKSGAEKISLAFGFVPKYRIDRHELPGGHREYEIICELYNRDMVFQGEGVGECSTMEPKYRYRNAERVCPECGVAAIIRGKKEYGGGWLCWKAKNGCGAKFADTDPAIMDQGQGKVDNPDPAELYNTVKKMAKKRAYVDACITASASGSLFTQDLEENGVVIKAAPPASTTVEAHPDTTSEPPAAMSPNEPHQQRVDIGNMLLEMCGTTEEASAMLQIVTSFKNKEGKTIKGRDSVKALSEKQVPVVYRKVKEQFTKWQNAQKATATTADDIPFETEDELRDDSFRDDY